MCLSLIVQSYTKLFKMLDLSQKKQRRLCAKSAETTLL